MARRGQATLPMKGAEGPDPELDSLARDCLDALDEQEKAAGKCAGLEDKLKAKLLELKKEHITVGGVTFKLKSSTSLVKKGKRDRSEGREEE